MKILLINNFHYRKGGSEAVYFNTADLLRRHGHEVVFFSCIDDRNERCAQEKFFVTPNDKLPRIKGAANYFYNTAAARNLKRLLEAEKPDIAHIHLLWGGLSPSILGVLKHHGIPIVHTAHDYRMVCPAYTFRTPDGRICEDCKGRKFYKCAIKRCSKGNLLQSTIMAVEMYIRNVFFNPAKTIDGFIFVSEFSRNKHVEYAPAFANTRSIVLYNTTKNVRSEFMNCGARRYFLFFGRLSEEKGISTLIRAFAELPEYDLKIVGTGSEEAHARELARDCRNIKFLGYKQGDELKRIIADASFVLVPSEWYENNPMTIIEAYTQGVPVIGSHIGGIPEIIAEGGTGYTFAPKDAKALAETVKRAQSLSEKDYDTMIRCTAAFATAHFGEEEHYKRLIGFYKSLIELQRDE